MTIQSLIVVVGASSGTRINAGFQPTLRRHPGLHGRAIRARLDNPKKATRRAYAVTAYAEPRSTRDIDIWVEPTPDNAKRVYEALRIFEAPMSDISVEEFAQPGLVFQLGVAPVRIDLLTAIDGVGFEDAWTSRTTLTVGDEKFPLISLEHLMANKLAVGRPKDLLDHALLEKHRKPKAP